MPSVEHGPGEACNKPPAVRAICLRNNALAYYFLAFSIPPLLIATQLMLKEFKEFAMRGNVIDMAVGIIIGAAFTPIVQSLVNDVIMPPIGLVMGDVDFSNLFVVLQAGDPAGPYATLAAAKEAGAVTINYGVLITTIISFIIVAFAIFILIKGVNNMKREKEQEAQTEEKPSQMSTQEQLLSEIRDLLKEPRATA